MRIATKKLSGMLRCAAEIGAIEETWQTLLADAFCKAVVRQKKLILSVVLLLLALPCFSLNTASPPALFSHQSRISSSTIGADHQSLSGHGFEGLALAIGGPGALSYSAACVVSPYATDVSLAFGQSGWVTYGVYILAGLLIEIGIAFAMLDSRRRMTQSQNELKRLCEIDRIIAQSSARLSGASSEQIDFEIQNILESVLIAEGADQASWIVVDGDGLVSSRSYSAQSYSYHDAVEFYASSELPWVTKQLIHNSGAAIILEKLSSLPSDAHVDRAHFEQKGVKSIGFFPSHPEKTGRSFLKLVHLTRTRKWPTTVSNRLLVLSRIFANALRCKEAQHALLDNEQMFRSLVTEAPIGIALEDLDGNIQYANPALCSMLGYTREEMTGMNCSQFADVQFHEEEGPMFEAMRTGKTNGYRIEKCYNRKDGKHIWGQVNVSTLQSSGTQPVVLATVEDVSEKKAFVDELKRAHEEMSQLTSRLLRTQEDERARIARELHDDIGQRLSLVTAGMDMLRVRLPSEKARELKVPELLHDLDELVSDVHNLSHQLHSSKLQHLGLSAAVNELCRQNSNKHRVAIELTADQISRRLPEQISLCFYRVAQEALNNAIRHSSSPSIEVKLMEDKASLHMEITDFGVGFNPTHRDAGLGLVTMHERLKIIGGKLAIESRPGKGCRVVADANFEQSC